MVHHCPKEYKKELLCRSHRALLLTFGKIGTGDGTKQHICRLSCASLTVRGKHRCTFEPAGSCLGASFDLY